MGALTGTITSDESGTGSNRNKEARHTSKRSKTGGNELDKDRKSPKLSVKKTFLVIWMVL